MALQKKQQDLTLNEHEEEILFLKKYLTGFKSFKNENKGEYRISTITSKINRIFQVKLPCGIVAGAVKAAGGNIERVGTKGALTVTLSREVVKKLSGFCKKGHRSGAVNVILRERKTPPLKP